LARKIAVCTNKGGVLKTTVATNLAGIVHQDGKRVLLVDTDNQGNVALTFGKNPDDYELTIYDVLVKGVPAEQAIIRLRHGLDLLPSNDDMGFFEHDIFRNIGDYPDPYGLLRRSMAGVDDSYYTVIIDTPPNLGLTTAQVLSYVDEVIIPFQPETYSMRSLTKIIQVIEDFRQHTNPQLRIAGVLATLVDSRTALHDIILQECRKYCHQNGIPMFETVIPKSIRFANAVAYKALPATIAAPNDPVVRTYFDLAKELDL
jgi:chromosome partitioning protein